MSQVETLILPPSSTPLLIHPENSKLNGNAFTSPSRIQLLINGEQFFPELIKSIDECKDTIFINMFIWRDDKIGNFLAGKLLSAAERGVKIRVLKDLRGEMYEKWEETRQSFFHKNHDGLLIRITVMFLSWFYPNYYANSSQSQIYNPLVDTLINHANIHIERDTIFDDHSKYIIIDESILFVGGINFEEKELSEDFIGRKYNDYMMKFECKNVVKVFKKIVNNEVDNHVKSDVKFVNNRVNENGKNFQIQNTVIELIRNAKRKIVIEMAYWGNAKIFEELMRVGKTGVEIEIFTSEKSNIVDDMNKYTFTRMFEELKDFENVKLSLVLVPTIVHAKSFSIDDELLWVGSANFVKTLTSMIQESNVLVNMRKTPDLKRKYMKHLDEQRGVGIKIGFHNFENGKLKYGLFRKTLESFVC